MKNEWSILFLSIIMISCGGNREQNQQEIADMADRGSETTGYTVVEDDASPSISTEAMETFDGVLDDYLQLTKALVETDPATATIKAEQLSISADQFRQFFDDKTSGTPVENWNSELFTYSETIKEETDVETQRRVFEKLSTTMISMVEYIGHNKEQLFHQRCPMVNGGNGDWLSTRREIFNPYHGTRMLNCGTVVRELQGKGS